MPAIKYSDVSNIVLGYIQDTIADERSDTPYADILEKLAVTEFDEKLLAYIEITRALMAEISSDVEARRLRTASAKMMAAMSESPGTYADTAVPPFVGIPNLSRLLDTDRITILAASSYEDVFDFDIVYSLESLGGDEVGPPSPPTTIDELVTVLNDMIETQSGDGYPDYFEFFNAGNGSIGFRLTDDPSVRGMNLILADSTSDGSTSLLASLGMVAGVRDNAVRARANDACQRALAPFLTTLRYLPPPEQDGGGDGGDGGDGGGGEV